MNNIFKNKLFYILMLVFTFFTSTLGADRGVLKRVVDGDTLHFSNAKCRILYIDTPESKRNKKALRDVEKCRGFTLGTMVKIGKLATAKASSLVKVGKSYRYDVKGKDRYNRSLCVVYTPNGVFNELMVESGYAMPYERYVPLELKRKYNKLAQKAKSSNSGLWTNYNIDCIGK